MSIPLSHRPQLPSHKPPPSAPAVSIPSSFNLLLTHSLHHPPSPPPHPTPPTHPTPSPPEPSLNPPSGTPPISQIFTFLQFESRPPTQDPVSLVVGSGWSGIERTSEVRSSEWRIWRGARGKKTTGDTTEQNTVEITSVENFFGILRGILAGIFSQTSGRPKEPRWRHAELLGRRRSLWRAVVCR